MNDDDEETCAMIALWEAIYVNYKCEIPEKQANDASNEPVRKFVRGPWTPPKHFHRKSMSRRKPVAGN